LHKDGEWKSIRNAQQKAMATKPYAYESHGIEDSYDQLVVRFLTDTTAHYYKAKQKGKRVEVQMEEGQKPFELNKKNKPKFDVLL